MAIVGIEPKVAYIKYALILIIPIFFLHFFQGMMVHAQAETSGTDVQTYVANAAGWLTFDNIGLPPMALVLLNLYQGIALFVGIFLIYVFIRSLLP